ncbi:bola-like protein [Polyplosphaeria fusca]|uniref:Bola-like protein n=1 Tax=Polyplosphaeria fusca TaxID=682080 RepID=A0A9P4QZ21_9PLEO|nr:bola-like protein [Polyplosphaeria fusca]
MQAPSLLRTALSRRSPSLATCTRAQTHLAALRPRSPAYTPPIAASSIAHASRRCYSTPATPPQPQQPRQQEEVQQEEQEKPEPPDHLTPGERAVFDKLLNSLSPVSLSVRDISGGCGSMYGIEIESSVFKGMSVVKQHRLVNEVLREEIGGWHGVQLRTGGGG